MGALFQLTQNMLAPAPGTRILRAHEVAVLHEASAVLLAAQQRSEAIQLQAEEAYEARRNEGYRDGLDEGRLENAEKLMETAMSSVAFIESIESTLVDVVVQSLRKIVGEIPPEELITGIIRQALTTVRNQQRVTVRVAPGDEKAVRTAFATMLQRVPGDASFLDLLVDARLDMGSCILESELGVVDASVETQLKAMENAFKVKIAR